MLSLFIAATSFRPTRVPTRTRPPLAGAATPVGIHEHHWSRGAASIHYAVAGDKDSPAPPVLLLNGFGVGFFHWHRVMESIAEESGAAVFGMDYCGQGDSWPVACEDGNAPSEAGRRYAIDDWVEQTVDFVEQVIRRDTPCHLVGNSLGGQIGALVAARRPDLVRSLVLLNATPVWGSNLPGWDGVLPPPPLPRAVGRFLYDRMRDTSNIQTMLSAVYAEPKAIGDELPAQIRAVTDASEGGHAAFASILWSPPSATVQDSGGFDALLRTVEAPCLLLYGSDDPWVTPAFGRSAARALAGRGGTTRVQYVELSPCGHCPQHEAPRAVSALVGRWLRGEEVLRVGQSKEAYDEEVCGVVEARAVEDAGLSVWDELLTRALR